jgi:hypothetical protein
MAKHKGYTVAEGPMGFSVEGGSDRVKVIISLSKESITRSIKLASIFYSVS